MSDGTDGDGEADATNADEPRDATSTAGPRDATGDDPEYDVPTRPSIGDRLVGGAADKPVLAVFVVILVLLAVGFLAASLFAAAQFLGLF